MRFIDMLCIFCRLRLYICRSYLHQLYSCLTAILHFMRVNFQFAQLRKECTSVRRNKSIIAVMAAGSIKKHYEVKQSKM